jgi:insecticidal toxin
LPEALQALLETAEHAPYIAVESGAGKLQWFDAANAQLIRIAGQDLPHDCELLGTRHQHVLLHERPAHRVFVYPGHKSIGPFEYMRRDARSWWSRARKSRRPLATDR